jgi:hypothetical protein
MTALRELDWRGAAEKTRRDEEKARRHYWIGLDLGQAADYTALGVLRDAGQVGGKPAFECGHLERFALGVGYPQMVEAVVALTQRPELAGGWDLIPDATGVGRPVIDLLRGALGAAAKHIHPVTIGGGNQVTLNDIGYVVPKRDLVVSLKVLLEGKRLTFAGGLPEVGMLVKEAMAFQVKITTAAHDTYGAWREGSHDDLVLAVALAAWYASRFGHPKRARTAPR